jgi:hypothetical protein
MTEQLFRVVAVATTLISAACGGKSSSSAPTPVTPTPSVVAGPANPDAGPAVSEMLPRLEQEIASAAQANQDLIPRNPNLEALLRARIAILQDPALPDRIRNERWYASDAVTSRSGRVVSLGTVFIQPDMRADATNDLGR